MAEDRRWVRGAGGGGWVGERDQGRREGNNDTETGMTERGDGMSAWVEGRQEYTQTEVTERRDGEGKDGWGNRGSDT